jgi:predicted nucleotidyltransferase component of viral defense system
MTDREAIMYQILGVISGTDTPLIFKGALITKLILAEHDYTDIERQTRDIDANWIDTPPSMEELESAVNLALKTWNDEFRVESFRTYGDRKSAGLYIIENATNEKIITMDIDMRPSCGSRVYYYGDTQIKGVLVNEILADKITVLSKHVMFRRSKDLIDVYALTHCVKVMTEEIFDVIASKHLELGEFAELLNRRDDVEHAYNKLRGVDGKPPFEDVYTYLTKFVHPFAQRDETLRLWNSDKQGWENRLLTVKKQSVRAQLHNATQRHQKGRSSSQQTKKQRKEPER